MLSGHPWTSSITLGTFSKVCLGHKAFTSLPISYYDNSENRFSHYLDLENELICGKLDFQCMLTLLSYSWG
ncbi:hypothetical protein VNO77_01342 [Canavalia gladiata]|uniref:Uncharacterized protein n=1 Tax=Canavalia gladiata TaxID=3824 RepID=A0AAN9MR79_CANGL